MSTATQSDDTEHEILTYLRTRDRIDDIVNKGAGAMKMKMKMKTPLAKALDDMSCIPFVQKSYNIHISNGPLTIAGVEAGTIGNPKVDVILEKSIPSSFGKGSETVFDPSYRSGREIHGKDIKVETRINQDMLYDVREFMFPGRFVYSTKLYKLAVYEAGGHFDWHMDSTHSDKHHATLLVALNTSWEGGDLVLRRGNGIETHVDLRPQNKTDSPWTKLQAVIFFTDIEHRVEPVNSGIRIVLQFDVELEKTQKDKYERDEAGSMDELEKRYSQRVELRLGGDAQATTDKAALEKVLAIIKELHNDGTQEVAFALQHLYRKSSISSEYLKGSDSTLYDALKASGEYDVSLHPVILQVEFDIEDSGIQERYVYRCDAPEVTKSSDSDDDDDDSDDDDDDSDDDDDDSDDDDDDSDDDDDDSDDNPRPRKKTKQDSPTFHIPELSGIQEISKRYFMEHTGNDSTPAEYRYFGGGMFVRPKSESSTK